MNTTERKLIVDAELKALIPPLTRDERQGLEVDILEDGCRESIKVWRTDEGDVIIDGYNRHEVCTEFHLNFKVEVIDGIETREDAKRWMIANQFHRRNLNESQRASLASLLGNLELGANQYTGKTEEDVPEHLPHKSLEEGAQICAPSQKNVAEQFNVSRRSVQYARKVHEHGIPELSRMLTEGTVSVSAAADVASLPEEEQEQIVEGGPESVVAAAREIRNNKKVVEAPESDINADGVIHCAQCGTSAKVVKDFDIFQGVRYYVICENEDCCVQTCMRKKREEVLEIWNKRVK